MTKIDLTNIYLLCVKAMGEIMLLESRSKEIVPYFLSIFENEYETVEENDNEESVITRTSQARKKIIEFCNIFSKVRKPRSLYKSNDLYAKFLDLISNGDSRLQKGGLDCILTWQEEPIIRYKQNLLGLVK